MLFLVAMSQLEFKTPGNLLNHLLTEHGWPQRVLAKVMGVSDSYVSKIVTGTKPVSAAVALQLEDALGVSADDFLALQRAADLREARAAHTLAEMAATVSDEPIEVAVPENLITDDGAGRARGRADDFELLL